jgi:arsenate reductase
MTAMTTAKTVSIYGIKACDTMKKARSWLEAAGVDYAFHDYKTQGIDAGTLRGWANAVGWERLVNRAGTTFRSLSYTDKIGIDETKAIALMVAQPSMIKRPVLDVDGALVIGFDAAVYAKTFAG